MVYSAHSGPFDIRQQTVPCVQAHNTRVLLARQFLLHELHSVEELWDGEHFVSLPSSNLVLIGFVVLTAVTVTVPLYWHFVDGCLLYEHQD